MIFLIEYNRQKGTLITFRKFRNGEKTKAQKIRLELELNLNKKNINHEVVILEAAKESILRHTHRRYFESIEKIARSIIPAL